MMLIKMSDTLFINPEEVEGVRQVESNRVIVTMKSRMEHVFLDTDLQKVVYRVLGRSADGSFDFGDAYYDR